MRIALPILLFALSARAAEVPTIAVTEFQAEAGDRDRAKGLSGVVATRLASFHARVVGIDEIKTALDFEKQKQLAGCEGDSCLAEISGALGVRYLVHGRLDRFGKSSLLNGFVFDSRNAKSVLRWSQRVDDDALLVGEAEKFAVQAAAALGLEQPKAVNASAQVPMGAVAGEVTPPPPLVPDFHVNVKLGNTVASLHGATLSTFNLRFDIEGDYYFNPHWQAFMQVGVVIGSATDDTGATSGEKTFTLVPAFLGAKYTFRPLQSWRPYLGAGIGFGLINKLFQRTETAGVNSEVLLGLAWVPAQHFGLNFEAGVNLASVSSDGGGLYFGFTTNFGVLALF